MKIPFIPFIGLMGVGNDNTLYTPSGKRICKVRLGHPGVFKRFRTLLLVGLGGISLGGMDL